MQSIYIIPAPPYMEWFRLTPLDSPVYGQIVTFDRSDLISCQVQSGRLWEEELCRELAFHYVPGTDVLDIGANLGLNTLLMNHYAPITGTVHLFEPQADVFSMMSYNTRSLKSRRLYNMCLSDGPKLLGYTKSHYNVGATVMKSQQNADIGIASLALDTIPFANKISVVKMDVEGHEEQVLRGAQRVLFEHKPMLFIEIWGDKMSVIDPLLTSMNYTLFKHIGGDDYIYKHSGSN